MAQCYTRQDGVKRFKHQYHTKQEARRAMIRFAAAKKLSPKLFDSYLCRDCDCYHYGRRPAKKNRK